MAAGEYVSVSSQADTEKADIAREKAEIDADPAEETRALAGIYERRGVPAHVTPGSQAHVRRCSHLGEAEGVATVIVSTTDRAPLNEQLSRVLRELRGGTGLNQLKASERAGVGHCTLDRYERGVGCFKLETVADLAESYGFDMRVQFVRKEGA